MKLLKKDNKGVTLTEVMVATVIFAFIMGGLYTTLLAGNASWRNQEIAIRSQQEARKAAIQMARDFRIATGILITQSQNTVAVAFNLPGEGAVNYSWDTSGGNANRIIRQNTTNSRILAQDISSLSIINSSNNVVIDITATTQSDRGESNTYQLVKKVAKR